jgi:hypothetical protein
MGGARDDGKAAQDEISVMSATEKPQPPIQP